MYWLLIAYTLLFILVLNTLTVDSKFVLDFDDDSTELDCPNGTKITAFVCLPFGYYKASSPKEEGKQKVRINSSLVLRHVREINVIERYMTVDISLSLYWMDNRITKKFSNETMNKVGRHSYTLVLPIETLDHIWSPDLYIFDMKEFESYKVVSSVNSLSILYNYYWSPSKEFMEYTKNNTILQYYVDARVKVYCFNFDFKSFPFEENNCTFLLGTSMYRTDFIWGGDDDWRYSLANGNIANGYKITNVSWINQKPRHVNKDYFGMGYAIGFTVNMKRKVSPYVIQYYIPCASIVMLSQISFIVPVTSIPGRVALLVTEFLTLTNIFIYQQVRQFRLIQHFCRVK